MTTRDESRMREVVGGERSFAEGVLVDLAAALRTLPDGALVAVSSTRAIIGEDLAGWSRLTGHAIVSASHDGDEARWVIRKGRAELGETEPERPIGSRLWLYTNFDCNLACDYCCVRSSPRAARRPLGLENVRRIVAEASSVGVAAIFVTGGEPFLLHDIGAILEACSSAAPTTVLTNGMLFKGSRVEQLRALSRESVTLQISIDSPTSELHDLHRGSGSWEKAMHGVRVARELGFRVRLAATVSSDADAARLAAFFDREHIDDGDRLVRRVALRGFADEGVALSLPDLHPEVTLTADGVYWHPVGATDDDFLVRRELFPLTSAVDAVRARWEEIRRFDESVATIFHCS